VPITPYINRTPLADRPWLLDLFCGAGGASEGYHQAGFNVIGVDIDPMPRYPFTFLQSDALAVLDRIIAKGSTVFAAIHASPPCQAHSDLQKQSKLHYEDFIERTRERLEAIAGFSDIVWVIENVEGAPLRNPVKLCGANDGYFPELRVQRHRLFESNVPLLGVPCPQGKHPLTFTHDKRKPHYGKLDPYKDYVQVTGGGNCPVDAARDAMGIHWMTKMELNEAIPPAYAKHVGLQLRASLGPQGSRLAASQAV
jgi:DNA (cytosine-5)-methyltransferase 1